MAGDNKDRTKKSASASTTTTSQKTAPTVTTFTTTATADKPSTTPSRTHQKEKGRQNKGKRLADYSDSDDQDEETPRSSRAEFLSLLARVNSMGAAAGNRAGPSNQVASQGQQNTQGPSLLLPPAPDMDDFQPVATPAQDNTAFPPPVLPTVGTNPQMAAMYSVTEDSQAPPQGRRPHFQQPQRLRCTLPSLECTIFVLSADPSPSHQRPRICTQSADACACAMPAAIVLRNESHTSSEYRSPFNFAALQWGITDPTDSTHDM